METQAKRLYEQAQREILKGGGGVEQAQKLELLRLFLESADFGWLRRESEKHLVEGKKVIIPLRMGKDKPKYEIRIIRGQV